MFKIRPVVARDLLLPDNTVDLSKWAVVACDQFTSQPEYWETLTQWVGGAPSTRYLIYPEAYLDQITDEAVMNINKKMETYVQKNVFKILPASMILVDRRYAEGGRRLGLVTTIDLETYDYRPEAKALIRSTEETVLSRVPPRMAIRKDASLELSHVMLLINDHQQSVIEVLYNQKEQFPKVYDFALNMEGGHITGYQIQNVEAVYDALDKLVDDPNNPVMFLVGDGNHSLATAKTHWETIKTTLPEKEWDKHPARYSLVEIVNIYDEGLEFEGIHRLLFNVDESFIQQLQDAITPEVPTWVYTKNLGKKELLIPKSTATAYEQTQTFIDNYLKEHKDASIDYIHGEQELISITDRDVKNIAIHMPILAKSDLFPFVKEGKILPRKSFSMGSAEHKRYYLETQIIKI